MSTDPRPADASPPAARPWRRRLLMLAIPLGVGAASAMVYLAGGRYASTDNAYVKADKIAVSAEVSGRVVAVHARPNQAVNAGEALFDLDPKALDVAVQAAQARLAEARTQVRVLQASYREKQAHIALIDTQQRFADKEQRRLSDLVAKNFVSATQYDAAKQAAAIAAQEARTQRADLQRIAASLGGDVRTPIDEHPSVRAALAGLAQAELQRSRAQVRAPQAGTLAHVPVLGQYVAAGASSAALVASQDVWVEANFTETELAHVAVGQSAEVVLDMASEQPLRGVVESIAPATGSEFALIPAQNATGNWVKIAQRVPVRIRLTTTEAPTLRAGLSATVRIDTGHRRSLWGWRP